ncbi:PH domain-containing protein [Bacillus sp. 03113]|uniref:PH domain-containing protein n=1 Tax=Bacillus sp. 03113 TaxID=2578211 RepID=UPI0011429604|nr:PH domain-containing protein [Bacillus sp. 03113]
MSNSKRLHPIAAVSGTLKQLKEMLLPFIFLVVFGSKGTNWDLYISIGAVVIILISGILSWLRFSYRIEERELRIEYGVYIKKKRYIPFEKIQSIDLSEGILHRPFGLVKVKVETAGSGLEAEAVLSAVTKQEAQRIQEVFSLIKKGEKQREEDERAEEVDTEEIIYKITTPQLFLLASSSGGVGVVISAVAAFVSQFDEIIPYRKIFRGLENFISSGIMVVSFMVFLGFVIAWLIALTGTMIKYAQFTVKKVENEFIISRGLLEKRQLTIPLHRIQAIRISENLLRQPIGYASVFVESAGGSVKNQESSKILFLPIVKKSSIPQLLESFLPDYQLQPQISPAPKRALKRYLFCSSLFAIPITLAAIIFFRPYGYFSLLFLLIVTIWSYFNYKDAGWGLNEMQLTLRYRFLIKHTVMMQKNKIQSMEFQTGYFQNQRDLATIRAVVGSGVGGIVVDLEKTEVEKAFKWYSHSRKE